MTDLLPLKPVTPLSANAARRANPHLEVAWSGESALPGDVPADDEGLDLGSSFVGDQGLHVAQVAHDMEVERDAVAT
jgi:hypothetical protein